LIKRDSKVVVLITGNGLKDIDSAMKAVNVPFEIEPKIEEVKRVLKEN